MRSSLRSALTTRFARCKEETAMAAREGTRVLLARREKSMVPYKWTGEEPQGLDDVETAENLGAIWEGDELVTYDLPGLEGLFEYYKGNDYLIDND